MAWYVPKETNKLLKSGKLMWCHVTQHVACIEAFASNIAKMWSSGVFSNIDKFLSWIPIIIRHTSPWLLCLRAHGLSRIRCRYFHFYAKHSQYHYLCVLFSITRSNNELLRLKLPIFHKSGKYEEVFKLLMVININFLDLEGEIV